MVNDVKSLTVIGAGAIGLSVGYFAQRAGLDVTVVDRGDYNEARCSDGNAGMIVPSHFEPLASPGMLRQGLRSLLNPSGPVRVPLRFDPSFIRWSWHFLRSARHRQVARSAPLLRDLLLESREMFATLAARHGNQCGLQHRGMLMICATQEALSNESHAAEFAQRLGIDAQVLDAAGVQRLESQTPVNCFGGVYYPLDADLQPLAYRHMLECELRAGGARIRWNTEVASLRADDNRVAAIDTTGTMLPADEIVVAGGAWSGQLLRTAGIRMPLQAGKGYSLTLPGAHAAPSIPSMLVEARVAVTPWTDQVRFAGMMEFLGLDTRIEPQRVAGMRRRILSYYPGLDAARFDSAREWCGLRPCSPDGLPFVGRSSRYANLSIATGHAMLGIALAPVTARLLTDVLLGRTLPESIAHLNPERFC
jgi:D-amino-acid dehydrogenase